MPMIDLVDPEGKPVDPSEEGITYQTQNQVQLLTVEKPIAGEWIINITNEDPGGTDAVFSILVSTNPCAGPAPETADTSPDVEIPLFLSDKGMKLMTGALIVFVILLAAATLVVVFLRQRKAR